MTTHIRDHRLKLRKSGMSFFLPLTMPFMAFCALVCMLFLNLGVPFYAWAGIQNVNANTPGGTAFTTNAVVKVTPSTESYLSSFPSNLYVLGNPPTGYDASYIFPSGYMQIQNKIIWNAGNFVTPANAVSNVVFRVVQDMLGTNTDYYRSPAPGTTGQRVIVSSSALDGIDTQVPPVGHWSITNNYGGDSPSTAVASFPASTYSSNVYNITFNDYIQYQVTNYATWHTVVRGTWSMTGTSVATPDGAGGYTANGGTTVSILTNFSPSTDSPNLTPADKSEHSF